MGENDNIVRLFDMHVLVQKAQIYRLLAFSYGPF